MSSPILADSNVASNSTSASGSQTNQASSKPDKNDTVRAIRLEFMEGILEFAKNNARVKMIIEWEPLSSSNKLKRKYRESGINTATIKIPNTALGNVDAIKNVIKNVKDDEQKALFERAIPLPDSQAEKNFQENWSPEKGEWRSYLKGSITPSNYFSLLRDYRVLQSFLKDSKGTEFRYQLPKDSDEKYIEGDEIEWQITVYEFCVERNDKGCKVPYYRYTAKAITKNVIEKLVPQSSLETKTENGQTVTSLPIKVGADLVESDKSIALLDDAKSLSFPIVIKTILDPPRKDLIDSLSDKNAANDLTEGFLAFVGGRDEFGKIATSGILGGTENISIISGGLVDFGDDNISALVGANREFNPLDDVVAGLLFGVGLDDDPTLFFGPSVRINAFTLSPGINLVEVSDNLEVNIGALFSLDLSRLTGSKKEVNVVKLKNPESGGGWYRATDEFAEELNLVELQLKGKEGQKIKLRQICDFAERYVEPENQTIITLEAEKMPKDEDIKHLKFIPKGYYKIEEIPSGFAPTIGGNRLSSNLIKAFAQDVFISRKYELVQSNNNTEESISSTAEDSNVMEQKLCPATTKSEV